VSAEESRRITARESGFMRTLSKTTPIALPNAGGDAATVSAGLEAAGGGVCAPADDPGTMAEKVRRTVKARTDTMLHCDTADGGVPIRVTGITG
jgi:CTP:molybdopterin cytidylyltransferase MocA